MSGSFHASAGTLTLKHHPCGPWPDSRMLPEPAPSTTWIQRGKSFRFRNWVQSLISPEDSAHELSLGMSIGVFVGLTPLFGLHLILIIFVAFVLQRLMRFNKALAVAASYVNNPVTFAPIIWASYQVGAFLIPSAAGALNHGLSAPELDWHGGIRALPRILYAMGLPMLVGCLVLGTMMALVTYPVTYSVVKWYRRGQAGTGPGAGPASPASEASTAPPVVPRSSSWRE